MLILKIVLDIISMTQLKLKILILIIFYWRRNHMKIFWSMTFHKKRLLLENDKIKLMFDKVD